MKHQKLASKAEIIRYQKEYQNEVIPCQKMYRLDVIPIPYIFYPTRPRNHFWEENLNKTGSLFLKDFELPSHFFEYFKRKIPLEIRTIIYGYIFAPSVLDASSRANRNQRINRSLPPIIYRRKCRAESSPVGLARFDKNAVPECIGAFATKFKSHKARFNAKFGLFDYFRSSQYHRTIRTMITLCQAQTKSIGRTQGGEDLDVLEEALAVFWRGTNLDLGAHELWILDRDVNIPAFYLLAITFVYGTLNAIDTEASLNWLKTYFPAIHYHRITNVSLTLDRPVLKGGCWEMCSEDGWFLGDEPTYLECFKKFGNIHRPTGHLGPVENFTHLCRFLAVNCPNIKVLFVWVTLGTQYYNQNLCDDVAGEVFAAPQNQRWIKACKNILVKERFELHLNLMVKKRHEHTVVQERQQREKELKALMMPWSLLWGKTDDLEDDLGLELLFRED